MPKKPTFEQLMIIVVELQAEVKALRKEIVALKEKLEKYENNDFGIYKSYHVINSYSNFFGGYWHDDDFGFGHYSDYDDKPGKKIWIWGLSDQGMIWEDLLTDNNGQYIEYQAGKLFNQAAAVH